MIKSILIIVLIVVISTPSVFAQLGDSLVQNTVEKTTVIEQIYVNKNVSTHFIMEDAVKYSDISNPSVVGDIPIKNVLRIKPLTDSVAMVT